MIYVALLRGINVGGNAKVDMARLKVTFENLGFTDVKTYINSGNVIFIDTKHDIAKLDSMVEAAIEKDFGFHVPVVIRDFKNIQALNKAIPKDWINDGKTMKTDVLFLWKDYDNRSTFDGLAIKPHIEDVTYLPGAIVWRVDRQNINKSSLLKIVGTPLYKHVTIRNINTVRKLHTLMQQ